MKSKSASNFLCNYQASFVNNEREFKLGNTNFSEQEDEPKLVG